jgi:phytoene dehydrogenase-like protein
VKNYKYDAVVVGSGPNGLAAAICLAQRELSVLVVESKPTVGGGVRSAELTLPDFVHDVCSAIHPLAVASPFFQTLPLEKYGLEFIEPPASLAHPFDDGTNILLKRSVVETAEMLGVDRENYKNLMQSFVKNWDELAPEMLAPLHFPKHPFLLANFGLKSFRSAEHFAEKYFDEAKTKAMFAGCAAHSMIPLEDLPSAAFGFVLAISAHTVGWKFPRGGANKISEALATHFLSLGGEIQTDFHVENIDELPSSRVYLFDVTPKQILKIAGHKLPSGYRQKLANFQYGAGVFKIDFALSEAIPWKSKECGLAGTVHLGGTFDEIAEAERQIANGSISEKPFVLLAQNSLFDETRTPQGKHTAWAYCHVPNGSDFDMSEIIEDQIERFAPDFRDCILAKSTMSATDMESYNANYIGGDINGGANILSQIFTRPVLRWNPYSTPAKGIYICSSSTPPGGGVHGMCGFHAAQTVLANEFGKK